jgi:ribosomal protein S18 acetylase RimI-like enzyme
MPVLIEPATRCRPADLLAELLARQDEFWGGRDMRQVHSAQWFHQFGQWGRLARDAGRIVGYQLGVVTADGVGYVQAIAVLPAYRRAGLAARLWRDFAAQAAAAGATRLAAVTTPTNTVSVAFHTGLGMAAEEIPDYAGPGQPRILFSAPVGLLS